MYTREQASAVRQKFWTNFGMYMRPVPSAISEKVNWINYNTGIKGIAFKMDADKESASICIQISLKETVLQEQYFDLFVNIKRNFFLRAGEDWNFEKFHITENAVSISIIKKTLENVNIFKETDWPTLISFLKTNIMALDAFWAEYKVAFEMVF
jgi:Domain of unknown function (DUF4268)